MGKIESKTLKKIHNATKEEDLKHQFWNMFDDTGKKTSSFWESSTKSEGRGQSDLITKTPYGNIQMEYKIGVDLSNPFKEAKVIVQILFDLKKNIDAGEFVGVVGGVSNFYLFFFPVKVLEKYLSRDDINWEGSSSDAPRCYPTLVEEISKDENIQSLLHKHLYNIDEDFDPQEIRKEMERVLQSKPNVSFDATHNIMNKLYKQFSDKVIDNSFQVGQGRVRTLEGDNSIEVDVVIIFTSKFDAPDDFFQHPIKRDVLQFRLGDMMREVKINPQEYEKWNEKISLMKKKMPSILDEFIANKDQHLEELYRRFTGAFYTSKKWANEAHKMIAEQFGENWKEEYVVWNPAAGTGNLTKGREFGELYLSTLEQGDVDILMRNNRSPGAKVFQYDFLSEIHEGFFTGIDKVPDSLKKAFESGKRPIMLIMNPPYGTSSGMGERNKEGIAKNAVNTEMLKEKMGGCSAQLYAQFLYKCLSLKKLHPQTPIILAFFSQPNFMTAVSYKKFRKEWEKHFTFLEGMLFSARHFSDISADWPVMFSIWGGRKYFPDGPSKKVLALKDINSNTGEIEIVGFKEIYTPDGNTCMEWIKKEVRGLKKVDAPMLSTAIQVKKEGDGKISSGGIGTILLGTNDVSNNNRWVKLFSSACWFSGSVSITPANFRNAVDLFAARQSVPSTWKNGRDEYLIPNIQHSNYEQWSNDAILYSLFNDDSQQSALRNISYKNKQWNIKNEFFPTYREKMMQFANDSNFNELYQDAKAFPEDRYVCKLLEDLLKDPTAFSIIARELLNRYEKLIEKSMSVRKTYHKEHPKLHLHAWDAGWAQLKPMLKEHFKEEYEEFVKVYKKFEDRMREGVYKFGFLRR